MKEWESCQPRRAGNCRSAYLATGSLPKSGNRWWNPNPGIPRTPLPSLAQDYGQVQPTVAKKAVNTVRRERRRRETISTF